MSPVSEQTRRDAPKVSVLMLTYNHEKYIAQAIESVLMQETDFQVELIIAEDCSTDGTRAIVNQYAERYPHLIRAFLRDHNLGAHKNYSAALSACHAEYIAYLEGDDYWTDASKLTRQVVLMDANPAMSFCFHRVVEFNESEGNESGFFPIEDMHDFRDPVEELIQKNFIPSVSRVMRCAKMPVLDSGFNDLKLGDWPISIMMALEGEMGFLPEKMAVYRLHPESTWSCKGQDVRDAGTYAMFFYLFQKRLRPYESSIARSTLRYSRFVLDHRRSRGLRPNLPLVLTSLKICRRTHLPDILVHAIWLVFFFILPERKGAWYDAVCRAGRAVTDPPPGSFLHTARGKLAKLRD
jgi:glycosyltransferase involved in cell wall biosynthesis